jgi:acyl carrier protein
MVERMNVLGMAISQSREQRIREIIRTSTSLGDNALTLSVDEDLWGAGMASLASVRVMVAIEEEFSFEFPDEVLTRATFSSIGSIAAVVVEDLLRESSQVPE